jgi:2-polyprenyl-6-methoxyphenol hydroxylase-like FAD-dependent oxidoreductase
LRTRLVSIPTVHIVEQCRTIGLEMDADRTRVIGVLTKRSGEGIASEPELMKADLVVDASGRNSATPKWLESSGFAQPEETSVAVRIGYASRFYQAPLPAWKALAVYPRAPVSTKSGVVFRVEGDRWIVTLMGCLGDYPPIDEEGFLEFARQLDDSAVYDWLQTAKPLGPAVPYRYPSHLRRRYDRLTHFPEGLLICGDALCSFNPIYGQGMSVSALEALALRDCLRNEPAGGEPLWRAFFKAAARIIEGPWSVATGADFLHPRVEGPRPSCAALRNWYLHRVLKATGRDPNVSTCFFEVIHLLRKPSALFRPDLLVRVLFAGR